MGNGYLALQGNIHFRTAQFKQFLKLLARKTLGTSWAKYLFSGCGLRAPWTKQYWLVPSAGRVNDGDGSHRNARRSDAASLSIGIHGDSRTGHWGSCAFFRVCSWFVHYMSLSYCIIVCVPCLCHCHCYVEGLAFTKASSRHRQVSIRDSILNA